MKKRTVKESVPAPMNSVGIDLGAEEARACWVSREGTVQQEVAIRMDPQVVHDTFAGEEQLTIVLEACNQAGWVARLLEGLGHVVLVCNPRNLRLIAASTLKTDRLDAQVLGRLARVAQLDPALVDAICVRSRQTQLQRAALKGRGQLVEMRTKAINFVRSVLRSDALPVPRCDADNFHARVDLEALPEDVRWVVRPHLETIAQLNLQLAQVPQRLREMAANRPEVARLTEIDGVGPLTALAFVLCLENPERFPHSRDVGAFLGLVPSVRQSGDLERRGSITKHGDTTVRRLLVQAALVVMNSKRQSALKSWALDLASRRGKKKAVVALARKLAVVMHRVWTTGESYERFPSRPARRNAAA